MPPFPSRIAIIGGGVIGLAIGWRLAQRGAAVTVLERDRAGRGASWAAAGMLAAGVETEPGEAALAALNRASLALWPGFAAELEAASGLPVGLRRDGTLMLALTRDDLASLRHSYEFQRDHGVDLHWLTAREALAREPQLVPSLAGAVFSPGDHQADNRALGTALAAAFRAAGGDLREGTEVTGLDLTAGRVTGVIAGTQRLPADTVVLAAGAWSASLPGLPPEARPPVRPVKGQMLAVRMDPAAPLLRHVVWAPKAYLVPRADGRLIVGATTEERGFDPHLTAGGLYALLDGAWRALPGIEELPIAETWVGFRPGSRDDAPLLGPTALPGLILATGHHRNGILLTPITAALLAEALLTGKVPPEMAPFAPSRFRAKDQT